MDVVNGFVAHLYAKEFIDFWGGASIFLVKFMGDSHLGTNPVRVRVSSS